MDLGPDMMRDKANDPFTIGWDQLFAGVRKPIRQSVDPDAPVRIEHDLDDRRILEPSGDCGSQRGAQHAGAA